MPDRLGPGVKPGDDDRYDSSGYGGCLTYIFTGRVGNCVMLPAWRAIGRFLGII